MARYIQQISLVPFSTTEMWVGWELEGIDHEIEGLIPVATLSPAEIAKLGVTDFQVIPAGYLDDLKLSIKKEGAGKASTPLVPNKMTGPGVSNVQSDKNG